MRILAIEDSQPMHKAMQVVLKEAGFNDVILKSNAEDAIDYMKKSQKAVFGKKVDVVLLDLLMPSIDSIDVVQGFRMQSAMADIPIIMVLSDGEQHKMEQALGAGVNDFLYRPLNSVELRARINLAAMLKQESDRRRGAERELEALNFFLERANRELKQKYNNDGLTGIANRRFFSESLRREWRTAAREGSNLSLLLCDLDHFNHFNELYGHLEGDICLVKIADVLEGTLRRPADLLARYGGEEFAALLPSTDADGAMTIAREMLKRVKDLRIENNGSNSHDELTVSIGMATTAPMPKTEPLTIIDAADKALAQAKTHGRGRIAVGSVIIGS